MSESNNNTPMRITQLQEATAYEDGMYYAVAKAGSGTKKINANVPTSEEIDLKNKIDYTSDVLKTVKKIIKKAYIASNGVITSGGSYNVICFQIMPSTVINISNSASNMTYGFYTSEPDIDSASYNNSRTIVDSGTANNLTVPSGCYWLAVRTAIGGDVSISPKSYVMPSLFRIPLGVGSDLIDIPNNTDLNDIEDNGLFYMNSGTYLNSPFNGQPSFLICYKSNSIKLQVCIGYNSTRTKFYIRDFGANVWHDWKEYDGSSNIINQLIKPETAALTETNLNNVFGNHVWLMSDSYSYTNKPSDLTSNVGFLIVIELENNWNLQLLYQFSGGKCWKRRGKHSTTPTWEDWQTLSGGGTTNQYTFNEYNNTYEVTATPSITTDTNSYLAPTGDDTDVTNNIVAMLTQTGVCRLGKGNYYVNNLVMPDNTMIIGSGSATQVILKGSSNGYAIKMNDYCVVKDLSIVGSLSDITLSGTVGNRHGILWQGNYTQTQSNPQQPNMGIVSDVYIRGFNGGGITCYDTGYGTYCHLEVTNAYIWNCNAGINVSYWSEFHKFTNVRTYLCYYGCINNGGNNVFVNCDFSKCTLAFLMDNSQDQSPNNSHGSCVGCVFNHTDNNSGIGIKILNCDSGFIFTGCQIFFSQIYIEDSDGVVVGDSNIGYSNCNITVKNGGAVLFANNLFQDKPTITITNNNKTHFINCYNRSTGAVIDAA